MSTIITKNDIINNNSFILKWSKNPGPNSEGTWNPGWKQQMESDRFLELVEQNISIFQECRFKDMESKEEDISYMRANGRLQSMKQLSGADKGAQITDISKLKETVPEFFRSKLVSEPFTAYTKTAKTFLKENIEKASFLNHIESMLSASVGVSAENIMMYGIKDDATTDADGIYALDGVFKQLEKIKAAYDALSVKPPAAPKGYFDDIDATKPLVPQMKKMITAYSKQKGKRSDAKFYVSSTIEGLLTEEADVNATEKSATLYFEGGQLKLWGVPITQADFMDNPDNDYEEQVLLADPKSILVGMLNDFEAENSYEHGQKSYLSSVDVHFDVLILWNKDLLAANVTGLP